MSMTVTQTKSWAELCMRTNFGYCMRTLSWTSSLETFVGVVINFTDGTEALMTGLGFVWYAVAVCGASE